MSDRGDRRRNINGANTSVSMTRQVCGMDLDGVVTERRELFSGQREAVKRANNTSGSVDPDGEIAWAGGILLERLPPHSELPTLDSAEFLQQFGGVRSAQVPDLLDGLAFGQLGEPGSGGIQVTERRALRWHCSCGQQRIEQVLASRFDIAHNARRQRPQEQQFRADEPRGWAVDEPLRSRSPHCILRGKDRTLPRRQTHHRERGLQGPRLVGRHQYPH